MPSMTFTIRAVEPVRSGKANDRAWTLYRVRGDAPGAEFTTFAPEWEQHVGETVTTTYEETQNGSHTNRALGEFTKVAHSIAPTTASGTSDRFTVLPVKLDRVLGELAAIRKHFTA